VNQQIGSGAKSERKQVWMLFAGKDVIDPTEIEILIQKIEQNKLEERERRLVVALLRTFPYIVAQLQEKKITLL